VTLRVVLAFLVGCAIGLVVAHMARAEDHFWISENPKYVERWRHETHCCGPSHCRRASEVGVVITQVTDGWQVAGGPLAKPEVVLAADTYETERPGRVGGVGVHLGWRD
jgi:hypothetical protein